MRSLEEGLPRLEENLERAARSYKAATVVGCDWFHSKVPQDLQKETRGDILKSSKKWNSVGDGCNNPARQCFWIPKKRHEGMLHCEASK